MRQYASVRARADFVWQIRPLPVVGGPFIGESLYGYLLRMSVANGLGGVSPILELLGLQQTSELRSEHIPVLARLFDARPAEVLATMNVEFWSDGQRMTIMDGHVIQRPYLIRSRRPRICPDCLAEFGCCRQVWELVFFVTCPLHGRLLLDYCPGCGRPLSWKRPSLSVCGCGCSLIADIDHRSPPEEAVLLCLHIWGALRCRPDPRHSLRRQSEPAWHRVHRILGGLSLNGLLRLIWILGCDQHLPTKKARLQPDVGAATDWVRTALQRLRALADGHLQSVPNLSSISMAHLRNLASEATTAADRSCALSVILASTPANQLRRGARSRTPGQLELPL
jgi:hypothetical protein